MDKMNLVNFGVQEMTQEELIAVEGGSIFSKAWNGIKAAGEWIGDCAEYAWYKFQEWARENQDSSPDLDFPF